MNPEEVRALLAELDKRLGAELAGFWHSIAGEVSSDEFRDLVISAYPEIVTPYIAAAADLGAAWYDLAPSDNLDYSARPAELAPVEKLQASASWALSTGAGDAAVALMQGAATRALFDGLRDTVVENVAAEPGARWARHASANACGFCRMLATRHVGTGATFYRSAESAGGVVGRSTDLTPADRRAIAAGLMTREEALEARTRYSSSGAAEGAGSRVGDLKARRTRGSGELGSKYHDHCHCIAVMVRPGQDYTPPPYVEQWNEDYAAARQDGLTDAKDIAKAMDNAPTGKATVARQARETAKAKKEAAALRGSAAGGGRPPKDPGASGATGFGDPVEPEWSGHTKGYVHPHGGEPWSEAERQARQRALPIERNGEQLHQHEIETVERLAALGEHIEWISRREGEPTNDFIWAGLEVDAKATRAKYSTISQRIRDGVEQSRAARENGINVRKENFLIDLGPHKLTPKLRSQLSKYNDRNPNNRAKRVWVLSDGGADLVEIDLGA
ncbi:hypothetical protein WKY82_09205 [Gordonia malaquae]|uniref:VG15 protein n=1 Tax=Gordonia malaquae TaxID=410332 RepID=UPI0030C79FF1